MIAPASLTGLANAEDCGPYSGKQDAAANRKGLRQFYRHEDDRAFFTIEREVA